jgi:hypothetical protein
VTVAIILAGSGSVGLWYLVGYVNALAKSFNQVAGQNAEQIRHLQRHNERLHEKLLFQGQPQAQLHVGHQHMQEAVDANRMSTYRDVREEMMTKIPPPPSDFQTQLPQAGAELGYGLGAS